MVTAAHCLYRDGELVAARTLSVLLGLHDRNKKSEPRRCFRLISNSQFVLIFQEANTSGWDLCSWGLHCNWGQSQRHSLATPRLSFLSSSPFLITYKWTTFGLLPITMDWKLLDERFLVRRESQPYHFLSCLPSYRGGWPSRPRIWPHLWWVFSKNIQSFSSCFVTNWLILLTSL